MDEVRVSNTTPEEAEITVEAAEKPKLERRGDVEKCPVCGSPIDAEAYHCAVCHSSFCYQCRARLLPADTQLECRNQDCEYYAKLVCSVCNPPELEEMPPAIYTEPEDGYWPALLLLTLTISLVVWSWSSFQWATLFALVTFGLGGLVLHSLGINIFGRERRIEHPRKSFVHHCISCREPVKELQITGHL